MEDYILNRIKAIIEKTDGLLAINRYNKIRLHFCDAAGRKCCRAYNNVISHRLWVENHSLVL